MKRSDQRRAEIAQALLHRPQVLVFDNPCGALSVGQRKDLARNVMGSGLFGASAVLWTTRHAQEAALADKVLHLKSGQLWARGTPRAFLYAAGAGSLEEAIVWSDGSETPLGKLSELGHHR